MSQLAVIKNRCNEKLYNNFKENKLHDHFFFLFFFSQMTVGHEMWVEISFYKKQNWVIIFVVQRQDGFNLDRDRKNPKIAKAGRVGKLMRLLTRILGEYPELTQKECKKHYWDDKPKRCEFCRKFGFNFKDKQYEYQADIDRCRKWQDIMWFLCTDQKYHWKTNIWLYFHM